MARIDRKPATELRDRLQTEIDENRSRIGDWSRRGGLEPTKMPEYGRYVTRVLAENDVLEPVLGLLRTYLEDDEVLSVPVVSLLLEAIDASAPKFPPAQSAAEAAEGRSNGLLIVRDLIAWAQRR